MYRPNLKFLHFPVPEIIGGTRKIWTVPGYAHAPISPKFFMVFCSDGPCYCCVRIAEMIAIAVLGGVRTPIWGRGGRTGSGMVPFVGEGYKGEGDGDRPTWGSIAARPIGGGE